MPIYGLQGPATITARQRMSVRQLRFTGCLAGVESRGILVGGIGITLFCTMLYPSKYVQNWSGWGQSVSNTANMGDCMEDGHQTIWSRSRRCRERWLSW